MTGGKDDGFDEIVAGLSFDLPAEWAPDDVHPNAAGEPQASAPVGGSDGPCVAMLLTGVEPVKVMAACCRVGGVEATTVPSDVGAVVVLDDDGEDECAGAASRLSAMLGQIPVVLLRRGPSVDPTAADVQASRWLAGERAETLAPGLILAQLPDLLEQLILGVLGPDEIAGSMPARSLSRFQAARVLATAMREGWGR